MSAKPFGNCSMIIVNYVDMWLMHSRVASQLDGAKLELGEVKARSPLLVACTSCPCTNLLILLAIVFYLLRAMHVALSRVRFFMLPKITPN
jgi:hypothetical protein